MKKLFIVLSLMGVQAWSQTAGVAGKWRSIDDETKKPKSIIEITQAGDEFKGSVVEIIESKEGPNPLCKKCEGDKKDKPITGMEILWGLKETEKGSEWGGGQILDPKNGKTYKCRMHLIENGDKLEVRGFIGFSLLGRTQVWERVK